MANGDWLIQRSLYGGKKLLRISLDLSDLIHWSIFPSSKSVKERKKEREESMETEKDNVSFRWHDTFVARWLSLLFIPSKLPICVCAWRSARTHCSCLLFCFLQMEMQEREREIHCTPHQFSRNAMMEYCALHDGNICSCERYFHLVFRKPMGMDLPFSRRWTKFPDFTLGIFPMRGIWKCGDVYNNHGIPFRFTMRYEKMIRHTAPSLSLSLFTHSISYLAWWKGMW